MRLRIATRQSPLALWQARHVGQLLEGLDQIDAIELVPVVTTGDRVLDRALQKIGGKGLFIKELEQAMLDGRADIAVHSMKDVPAVPPAEFSFPAVLTREDPRDAVVGSTLAALPDGATLGTSSLRRQAQLLALRPDLTIVPIRGNVQTRLARCHGEEFHALLLAVAGLKRLGLDAEIAERLDPGQMLPAAGQGVIGIECLAEERETGLIALLSHLNDPHSATAIAAERAVAAGLGADCSSPVAAYARTPDAATVSLSAMVATTDGRTVLRSAMSGPASDPQRLGAAVVEDLSAQGARELLAGLTA